MAKDVPIRFDFESRRAMVAAIQFDLIPVTVVPVQFDSVASQSWDSRIESIRVVACLQRADSIRFRICATPDAISYGSQPLGSNSAGLDSNRVVTGFDPIRFDSNRGRYESCPIPSHSRRFPVRFDSGRARSRWVTDS